MSPSRETVPRKHCAFARCKLPLVVIDRTIDLDGDVLLQDHRRGVGQAVDYLVSLGHRRIALFGPSAAIRPGREKLLGYTDGLARAGIARDDQLVCMLDSAIESTEDQMAAMLALPSPPSALIALGTRLLSGALHQARGSGLRVPQDLSVVAIGTEQAFALMDPRPTTLHFDIERAAEAAAQLMLDRIEGRAGGEQAPPCQITVPLSLVLGASCAAPRAPA